MEAARHEDLGRRDEAHPIGVGDERSRDVVLPDGTVASPSLRAPMEEQEDRVDPALHPVADDELTPTDRDAG